MTYMVNIRLMKDNDIIAEAVRHIRDDFNPDNAEAALGAAKEQLGSVEQSEKVKEKYNQYQIVFPTVIHAKYKGETKTYRKK